MPSPPPLSRVIAALPEALTISQAEAVSPVQTSQPIPSSGVPSQQVVCSGMRESALLQVLQATALAWLTSWETLAQPALLAQAGHSDRAAPAKAPSSS